MSLRFGLLSLALIFGGIWRGVTVAAPTASLTLAREGKTTYAIVESARATEAEKFAARELAEFLGRVTGASFPIVAEAALTEDARGIYVGWTDFAAAKGVKVAEMDIEEWLIRTAGQDLIITGGRPRGTLYGVYEFLQSQAGCYWLDRSTEVIPSRPTLAVGALNEQKKPWCWQRWLHSPTGSPDDHWLFLVRNRNFRYDLRGRKDYFPQGTFWRMDGTPRGAHTFAKFISGKEWFKTHPEYFSLVRGKRVPGNDTHGPGQLCLTNPDVLRLVLEKLREFIAKDREEAAGKGVPAPKIYWFNQNDVYDAHCQCPGCQTIVEREGGQSGPLIEFCNAMAQDIEKDYPDILIGTIAYNQTSTPPKHIKPRHNVLIGWCDVYSRVDGIRPLSHPYNVRNHTEITGWAKIAPRLAIGDDYWTALSYYNMFPTPYAIIDCVASDLKLFAELGVESFFCETADYMDASQQFTPLKMWLAYQLLIDAQQPVEPLIQTFMDGFFGAAGGKMREYLRYMRQRIDKDAQFQALRNEPHNLKYLDLDFFITSQRLFDEAEALVDPKSKASAHVWEERFILDGALLFLWPWLERGLPEGQVMPFDHRIVIARYERGWKAYGKGRYSRIYTKAPNTMNEDGKLMERMAGLFRNPQLPEQFRALPARDVADFNWLTFSQIRPRQLFVPDDEAAGRMTAIFTSRDAILRAEAGGDRPETGAEAQHRKAVAFGVTGGPTVTLKPEEIPQDGKYHLYKIGRITVKPKTMVWALEGQRLGVTVDRLYDPETDVPGANDWNAYISLKFQGPAYMRGDTGPNGVWMDRVLLVRPQEGETVDPANEAHLKEEQRRTALRTRVAVSRLAQDAAGDPARVNWVEAVAGERWWTLDAKETTRKLSARFAHDGTWLYVQLAEQLDPGTLVTDPGIWRGDDWELLFAAQRGVQPYRQIAINPAGAFLETAHGEGEWRSGVKALSEIGDDAWTLRMAFPLERLLPGGATPGQKIHVNILRGGKENLLWSPTFGDRFHTLERLGEIVLQQ